MWQDVVNGLFEACGAPFILVSIIKLYKEKQVRGVSYLTTAFFTAWGYWNMYYYPKLNQWYSFFGGCLIVVANTIWLGMLIYYSRKNGKVD